MKRLHRAVLPLVGFLMLACGGSEEPEMVASTAEKAIEADSDASTKYEPLVSQGVASLHGRILVDDDLSPEGFSVSLYEISPEDGEPVSGAMEFPGKDGTFFFSKVSPGKKRLVIDAEEPASPDSPLIPGPALIGSVEQSLELELGEVRKIEIDLRPHRPCRGHVTAHTRRGAAAGLYIMWSLPSKEMGLIGITDERGETAGWCPPAEEVTVLAQSRTGLTFGGVSTPLDCSSRAPFELELQVEGGSLTVVLPEGFLLGEDEQIRARLLPPGVESESGPETLIWSERIFEKQPWGQDLAYLLRGRACNLGLLPAGELRIEAILDDPETGLPGHPWPEDARRFEGKTTIVAGLRAVCSLR